MLHKIKVETTLLQWSIIRNHDILHVFYDNFTIDHQWRPWLISLHVFSFLSITPISKHIQALKGQKFKHTQWAHNVTVTSRLRHILRRSDVVFRAKCYSHVTSHCDVALT